MSIKQTANEKLDRDYRLYYTNLHRFCNVKLKNPEQADDCAQECFYILYQHYMKNEDIKNVLGFLYKIADNLIKAQWRENQKAENIVQLDSISDTVPAKEDKYSDTDYDLLAEQLLQSLNESEKELYRLKYIEHKSIKQIAEELNTSFDAVAKRLSRLRQKIKEHITEHFKGGDDF